jgi:hypothetical protein
MEYLIGSRYWLTSDEEVTEADEFEEVDLLSNALRFSMTDAGLLLYNNETRFLTLLPECGDSVRFMPRLPTLANTLFLFVRFGRMPTLWLQSYYCR